MDIDIQKIWLMSRTVIVFAGGFYIFILLFFSIFQSNFVYFPSRGITITPADIGLQYEDVFFETTDGLKLNAWFVPAKKSRGVILFCHGNGGNISSCLDCISIFYRLGLSTFIFDYRGYGQSKGRPSEKGTYLDAEAAWQYLITEKKINQSDIIIFGMSMGGAIAAWLAQDKAPGALIIQSAFSSIQEIGAEVYPYLPVKLVARFKYNTKEYLSNAKCPVLVIHSREDEMISFSHGQRLFETAKEPKELLEIKGTHNDGFLTSAELDVDGLDGFVSEYVE